MARNHRNDISSFLSAVVQLIVTRVTTYMMMNNRDLDFDL